MTPADTAIEHVVVFSRPALCALSRVGLAAHLDQFWRETPEVISYGIDVDVGLRGDVSADVLGRAQFTSSEQFEAYLKSERHEKFVQSVVRANDISLVSLQTRPGSGVVGHVKGAVGG
jgi:hypothetical protein